MDGDVELEGSIEVWVKPAWPTMSKGANLQVSGHPLELPKAVTAKLLPSLRYIHPKTPLSADGACSFDLEADDVGGISGGGHVQVFLSTRDIRSTIISQRHKVNFLGGYTV